MIFRTRIILLIVFPFLIAGLMYLPNVLPGAGIQHKIFAVIGVAWSSILYVFVLFEYYKIKDDSIVYVSWLGMKRKEAYFADIKRIYLYPSYANGLIKAIRIEYGTFGRNEIIVNNGVKDYKKLIRIVVEKSKCTPSVSIDNRIFEIIE